MRDSGCELANRAQLVDLPQLQLESLDFQQICLQLFVPLQELARHQVERALHRDPRVVSVLVGLVDRGAEAGEVSAFRLTRREMLTQLAFEQLVQLRPRTGS